MPSELQLTGIRARAASRRLKETCTISTPGTRTRDAYDEEVTGTPTEVEVNCSFAPVTAREVQAGDGIVEVGDYYLTLPANTEVASNATITVEARGGQRAFTFQVKSDLHRSDEIFTRVLCSEVNDGN